ncbi:MAG: hypothetical protein H6Q70_1188 [Firmicutes bacterium]|nr:hypothetical protein [Bacillota bacterium]
MEAELNAAIGIVNAFVLGLVFWILVVGFLLW